MNRLFSTLSLLSALTLSPAAAAPDLAVATRVPVSVFNFYEENDVLTGTDQYYTQGLKFSLLHVEEGTPAWLETLAGRLWTFLGNEKLEKVHNAGWTLGQNMYTGEDINRATIDPDDRPWAGWLYAGRLLQITTRCNEKDRKCRAQQHTLELDLGVVGPASGAEWAQTKLHEVIESPEPAGWGNQLGNEPGVLLLYKGKWRFPRGSESFDLIPHGGFALGNVLAYLSVGGTVRLGRHLSGFGTETIPAADTKERHPWEAYVFGGVDGRLTAVNIFLDGNHFRDSHSVEKERFVHDLSYGAAVRFRQLRITYTIIRRAPEFEPRSGRDLDPQNFGAVAISWER
ncbi:MAG TPA: lipid A deacylase LpxR family protein [Chloroflexia bacterium]|jgi:hypothetical protein